MEDLRSATNDLSYVILGVSHLVDQPNNEPSKPSKPSREPTRESTIDIIDMDKLVVGDEAEARPNIGCVLTTEFNVFRNAALAQVGELDARLARLEMDYSAAEKCIAIIPEAGGEADKSGGGQDFGMSRLPMGDRANRAAISNALKKEFETL